MIGSTLFHLRSLTFGTVDQITGHPDGKCLVRIDDHWFMADECIKPRSMAWIVVSAAALIGLGVYGLMLVS